MKPLNAGMQQYEAAVLEGLEPFARAEIEARVDRAIIRLVAPRPGMLQFAYAGPLTTLLDLRSVVAVSLLRLFAVPRPKALLGHQHFTALLAMIATARALWPRDAFATLHLSAAGEDSTVMQRLATALEQHTGLRPTFDEGDLLLRLRRAPNGWEALVRLSPRPLAARPWRVCNMLGALNASVASVMMQLSAPHPDDHVLNIGCGTGTLLIERLALGDARALIGCDIDRAMLRCAAANLAADGISGVHLETWDATALPLPNACMDVLCADLPFGQRIGSHDDNQELYPRLFAEATRVTRPNGRMVIITHEVRLLEDVAAAFATHWHLARTVRVHVGGMTPRIYLLKRTDH